MIYIWYIYYDIIIISLEKGMATTPVFLSWEIPWTEEPGRLQSMGSQRVRHNWATNTTLLIIIYSMIIGYQSQYWEQFQPNDLKTL